MAYSGKAISMTDEKYSAGFVKLWAPKVCPAGGDQFIYLYQEIL